MYLYYEYLCYLLILRYYYRKYSQILYKNSLSSIQLLQSQYTLLTYTNYPVTTHLSHVTLYNPVTQQKVVTYIDNYRCFANYFSSSLNKR